jgi:glycosyltransferase involved in cell wall biosynthesis
MTPRSNETDSRPIRVLYIDTGIGLAGGQTALIEVLKFVDRSAVSPTVTSPTGSAVASFCHGSGIPWLPLPFASAHLPWGGRPRGLARLTEAVEAARGALALAGHVRRTGAEIVHANTFKAALVCAAAPLPGRAAVIFHDRTLFGHMPVGWLVGLRASRIVVISRAVAAKYRGRLSRKMRLVPDGVDLNRFSPGAPRSGPGNVVGYLGRISREKGAIHLVRAARLVLAQRPGARFLIGGSAFTRDGQAYLRDLEGEVKRLGVGGSVGLVGNVEDAVGFLRQVDVLALPSESEGLGVVMLEAMAVGKPVVAFASGGPAEVISSGRDGIVVPPGDVSGMADAIVRLLAEPGLAEQVGRAARRTVSERYSIAATVSGLTATYLEVRPDRRRQVGQVR